MAEAPKEEVQAYLRFKHGDDHRWIPGYWIGGESIYFCNHWPCRARSLEDHEKVWFVDANPSELRGENTL